MRINLVSLFLDGVFVFIGFFILGIIFLNYFVPHPYSVVIAISLSGIFTLFSVKKMLSSRQKKSKASFGKKQISKTLTALNLMDKKSLDELLLNALEITDGKMVNGGYYSKSQNKGFLFKFAFEKVSKSDVVKAFNLGGEFAEIYSESFDKEVIEFAERFNGKVVLKNSEDVYNLLSEKRLLPNVDYSAFYTERKKPIIKKELLYKKNAKKFLIFGVTFCLFSFFAPIKIYYLISGGLMISYSIFLMLFGKEKEN
ncbi:MAG: hypothetical protein IKB98_04155 [Clostridia bacterium]|nr:hypothetical protein [Clostridia bacterium]